MFLEPVVEKEIINVVNNCKSKTSCDWDNLDMQFIKKIISNVVKPLSFICNKSFETGVFPEKMKMAKIIPLYTAGAKYKFTNYRPVSLLPQFSKILEKNFLIID